MKYPETIVDVRGHTVQLRDSTDLKILAEVEITRKQWASVQELIHEGIANTQPDGLPKQSRHIRIGALAFSYMFLLDFSIGFAEAQDFPSRFPGAINRPCSRWPVMMCWPIACKLFDVNYDEAYAAAVEVVSNRRRSR